MTDIETFTFSVVTGLSRKIVYKGPCEITFRHDEEGAVLRFKPLNDCRGFICDSSTVIESDEDFERLCGEGCFGGFSVQVRASGTPPAKVYEGFRGGYGSSGTVIAASGNGIASAVGSSHTGTFVTSEGVFSYGRAVSIPVGAITGRGGFGAVTTDEEIAAGKVRLIGPPGGIGED